MEACNLQKLFAAVLMNIPKQPCLCVAVECSSYGCEPPDPTHKFIAFAITDDAADMQPLKPLTAENYPASVRGYGETQAAAVAALAQLLPWTNLFLIKP